MTGAKIAVVGSLMIDVVVRVPRRPEVGESLVGSEAQLFVGGKGGNQAAAAARLGATSVGMVGRVGDDEFGRRIVAALEGDGVDCAGVIRDRRHRTGVAVPMVFDDGQNSIVVAPQANLALTAADVGVAANEIEGASMLLVQCEVAAEATVAAMEIARRAHVPVLLNGAPLQPETPALVGIADHLIVNEVEAAGLVPSAAGDHLAEARELLSGGPLTVVITLGEGGALVASREGSYAIGAFRVPVVDSVGAGDAFCAGYAVGLASGLEPRGAGRFGCAAGALAVTRRGAFPSFPRRAEVEALLRDAVGGSPFRDVAS